MPKVWLCLEYKESYGFCFLPKLFIKVQSEEMKREELKNKMLNKRWWVVLTDIESIFYIIIFAISLRFGLWYLIFSPTFVSQMIGLVLILIGGYTFNLLYGRMKVLLYGQQQVKNVKKSGESEKNA
jgi:hypothetical protein